MTTSAHELQRELTYLALHLHWTLDDLLDLEHPWRRRFVAEVGRLTGDR